MPNIVGEKALLYWKFPLNIFIYSCWLEEFINNRFRTGNKNENTKIANKTTEHFLFAV